MFKKMLPFSIELIIMDSSNKYFEMQSELNWGGGEVLSSGFEVFLAFPYQDRKGGTHERFQSACMEYYFG